MASGAEHRRAYLRIWKRWRIASQFFLVIAAALVVLGIFGIKAAPELRGLAIGLGILLGQFGAGIWIGPYIGMIANPDMDMENGRRGNTYVRNWPAPLQKQWARYWKDYADEYAHRSAESHQPGLATTIRFQYLFPPLFARTGVPWLFWRIVGAPFWWAVWMGMYRQDMSHAMLDGWFRKNRR
jgi:hypothetical protein